jgi:hypothetical protein
MNPILGGLGVLAVQKVFVVNLSRGVPGVLAVPKVFTYVL